MAAGEPTLLSCALPVLFGAAAFSGPRPDGALLVGLLGPRYRWDQDPV
ncbi:hypothetical protein ACIRBX_11020 [Kitasatospora sp. NPDC096147]